MKYLIRIFLLNVFALWLTAQFVPGVTIANTWQTYLEVGAILSFLMVIVKPILKILFIPINVMTFGILSWFTNVIVVYLLTLITPLIRIEAWRFQGWSMGGFTIPAIDVSYFASLIISTLVLSLISNVLHSVTE